MDATATWYRDFFKGVALDLWRKVMSPAQTAAEANFLAEALLCQPGFRLLDVPCGNGRHSLQLAQRGYAVTGFDVADEFLGEARQNAVNAGAQIEYRCGDMRELDFKSAFEGAFCFGNSFGYLGFADMALFLAGVSRSLKPGGRFVIDTGMAAESILPTLKERDWYQIEEILFASEHIYHPASSCLETNYTFVRGGEAETRKAFHWVYTIAEIERMLATASFRIVHFYGSLDRQAFKLGDRRLLVIAEKI